MPKTKRKAGCAKAAVLTPEQRREASAKLSRWLDENPEFRRRIAENQAAIAEGFRKAEGMAKQLAEHLAAHSLRGPGQDL